MILNLSSADIVKKKIVAQTGIKPILDSLIYSKFDYPQIQIPNLGISDCIVKYQLLFLPKPKFA